MAPRIAQSLSINSQPEQGSKGLIVNLDFTLAGAGGYFNLDTAVEQQTNMVSSFQSIWIDNHANTQPMTITFLGLNYILQIRAGRQGVWPLFATSGVLRAQAYSSGNVVVPVILLNMPLTPWYMDV